MASVIAVTAIAFVLSFLVQLLKSGVLKVYAETNEPSLEDKIKELSSYLEKSANMIKNVEDEINQKQQLVASLQKDEDTYKTLLLQDKDKVNAIVNVIQSAAKKENDKSFWKGVLVNAVFFLLGTAASLLITKFVK